MSLIADHLTFEYEKDTNMRTVACNDVSFKIEDGEFVAIIGHTGSGKTTLVSLLTALLKPTYGTVYLGGEDIFASYYDKTKLRSNVGIVFQYPEYQLFEETVFKDVCFGPKNIGCDKKETELRAYESLKNMGIPDELFYVSPFELSGGQKRKVAIAGVLAMKPKVVILDEPTAGLDPLGREEIFSIIKKIHKEEGITIILVSHNMDDVAAFADRVLVMDNGKLKFNGSVNEVYSHGNELEEMGLSLPETSYILQELKKNGINVDTDKYNVEDALSEILKAMK